MELVDTGDVDEPLTRKDVVQLAAACDVSEEALDASTAGYHE